MSGLDSLAAAVAMSSLPSRPRVDARLSAATRIDPYWTAMWDGASSAHWVSQRMAARHLEAGGRLSKIASGGEIETSDPRLRRDQELAVLGAVGMWRTATVEQVGALTGYPEWASAATRISPSGMPASGSLLFRSGLINRGLMGQARDRFPVLLRPDIRGKFDGLGDMLSMEQLLAVTAGQPWSSGSRFDRHNLITTELALRVAQWCPGAAMVLGEQLSRISMMVPDAGAGAQRSADMTIVRKDGLKIAIEVTASTGESTASKIRRWAEALVADESNSLVVVFVEAAHPDDRGTSGYLRNKITRAANADMEVVAARVADRMFVVKWSDWFPSLGMVSPDFMTFPVSRMDEAGTRVDLLDPNSQPAGDVDREAAMTLLSAGHGLLGVPYAMRNPKRAGELGPVASRIVREAAELLDEPVPPVSKATLARRARAAS